MIPRLLPAAATILAPLALCAIGIPSRALGFRISPRSDPSTLVTYGVDQTRADRADPRSVLLTGVTVIDVKAANPTDARLADRDVLVVGDRVEAIVPSGSVEAPADAQVVDAAGTFLIPGLWDMHVHLDRDDDMAGLVMGPLMVAHGVTGVRDMQADCLLECPPGRKNLEEMHAFARRFESGDLVGPRIVAFASDIVWGPGSSPGLAGTDLLHPGSAEEARKLARALHARGVDLVKIYDSVPREAFFALIEEAHALRLPVAGHLPWAVTVEEACASGLQSLEHARWPALACNPAYEPFRVAFAEYAAGRREPFPQEEFVALRTAAVQEFDEDRCREIGRAMAAAGTAYVPTHVTREMDARAGEMEFRNDPRRRWIPEPRLRAWDRDLDATAGGGDQMNAFYQGLFGLGLRVTGILHEEGVRVLAGTDSPDTQCFPGASLHDELEHLARAGLSPLEVLRAATLDPAEHLGRDGRFGCVEVGRAADLVVLEEDPLLDVGAVRRIRAVVLRGRVFECEELDSLLEAVEEHSHPRVVDLALPPDPEGKLVGTWGAEDGQRARTQMREDHLHVSFQGSPFYRLMHQGERRFRLELDPRVTLEFESGDRFWLIKGQERELFQRRGD